MWYESHVTVFPPTHEAYVFIKYRTDDNFRHTKCLSLSSLIYSIRSSLELTSGYYDR
jgi:hypothetical protein